MRRLTAALAAVVFLAAGCGGGAEPEPAEPVEPSATAAPATTRGRPQPTLPPPPPEPAPFVEDTAPPVEDLLPVEDAAPAAEDTAPAAEDTPDDAAPFVEDELEPAAPEPAPEPAPSTAPPPTAPPAPPAGPQPAPDDADVAPDIEDAGAETSGVWHHLGGRVLMSDLIDATSGPAHDGTLVSVPVPLDRWCVSGDPPLPWNPGEWIVKRIPEDEQFPALDNYYLILGVEEWPARVWPHQYVAKIHHYRIVHPRGIDPLPPLALPDRDNLSGGYEDMGIPNPFRLIEISDGIYAVNIQRFAEGEEVRCGDS